MLGNESDATFILRWYRNLQNSEEYYWTRLGDLPEGWKSLGEGCYRSAFLSPDGVVYKVQLSTAKQSQSNQSERDTLRKYMLTKLPGRCRLPRWNYFQVDGEGVIAMEYFSRLRRDATYDERLDLDAALRELKFAMPTVDDLHMANLAVDESTGQLVPIDLGSSYSW